MNGDFTRNSVFVQIRLEFLREFFENNAIENKKLHRLTERDSRLAHFSAHEILNNFAPILLSYRYPHFGLFGFFFWGGVFSYFRCKI